MEVILREAIEKLGHPGDVVQVKKGYARNYLLPRKLAYTATSGNLKVMEQQKVKLLKRDAEQREQAEQLRARLNTVEVVIERRVGERGVLYGSVTNSDIAEAVEAQGYTIDRRKILFDEHIKQTGEFSIPIRLFTEVIAEVKLVVQAEGTAASKADKSPIAESPIVERADSDGESDRSEAIEATE